MLADLPPIALLLTGLAIGVLLGRVGEPRRRYPARRSFGCWFRMTFARWLT